MLPGFGLGIGCHPDPVRQFRPVAGSGWFSGIFGRFGDVFGLVGAFLCARRRARAWIRSGSFNIRTDPPNPALIRDLHVARHNMGYHDTRETRVHNAFDDVASYFCQALGQGAIRNFL